MGSAFSQQQYVVAKPPTGRLTLATGTPVMASEQANKQNIYYTPYVGSMVPVYDGTGWRERTFTELTLALAGSANWASGSNYDLFIVDDGGTLRLLTGPAWTSDTARNAAISQQDGLYVNTASMTGRYGASSTMTVAASRGLYVGTVRMNASGQTTWVRAGGNGAAAFLYLWNMYNRVTVGATANDGTNSWTYATGAWRAANGGVLLRCSFVRGLDEDSVIANYCNWIQGSTSNTQGRIGVGLDGTVQLQSVNLSSVVAAAAESWISPALAQWHGQPGMGFHYCEGMEYYDGGSLVFYGDAGGPTSLQTGFSLSGRF